MEKALSRMISLPGVKAVYRKGELIYRHQEYQKDAGVKQDRVTHYYKADERI